MQLICVELNGYSITSYYQGKSHNVSLLLSTRHRAAHRRTSPDFHDDENGCVSGTGVKPPSALCYFSVGSHGLSIAGQSDNSHLAGSAPTAPRRAALGVLNQRNVGATIASL